MPDLMHEVMSLVSAHHGTFCWADSRAEIANCYSTVPPSGRELFFKAFYRTRHETDFLSTFSDHRRWPTKTPVLRHEQTLRVDRRTFRHSDFYNLLWRHYDIDEPLIMLVNDARRTYGTLSVYRASGDPPFDASVVRMLEAIAGFVAHAMTQATLDEEAFVETEDRSLIVADISGTVRHADVQGQQLMAMALTPLLSAAARSRHSWEPAPELVRLCGTLAAIASGHTGHSPPVIKLRNPWGEFVLRAYWLGLSDGAEQTRQIGITIERRLPRTLMLHRRVENLPLTGREKQLCVLMAQDRSRQALADAIGVSTGTIITHQSNIYAKLGVHSRAGLLAALLPG